MHSYDEFMGSQSSPYGISRSTYEGGYLHQQCSSSPFYPVLIQHSQHQTKHFRPEQHSQILTNSSTRSQKSERPSQFYGGYQTTEHHWRTSDALPTSISESTCWDINDKQLPKTPKIAAFDAWPDGHCQFVYLKTAGDSVKRHTSGWAMRNTNNHNKHILKKSCLGVLLCDSPNCGATLRPAICDKARKGQEGRHCTRKGCPGRVHLHPCRGNGGYPVTHFWREVGDLVFFQAKGIHGHMRPDAKAVRSKPNRSKLTNSPAARQSLGHAERTIASGELCLPVHIDPYLGTHLPSYVTDKSVTTATTASYNTFSGGVGDVSGGFNGTSLYSAFPHLTPSLPSVPLRRPDMCAQIYSSQHLPSSSTTTGSIGLGPSNSSWSDFSLQFPPSKEEVSDSFPSTYHTSGLVSELCPRTNPLCRHQCQQHHHYPPLKVSSAPLRVRDVYGQSSIITPFSHSLYDNSSLQSSGDSSRCSSNRMVS